ncbi:MAG: sialate O-acetylesterase [Clostridia bacterium]|nr:sialate O-acetylesterase [Clostridia bacterium]
MIMSLIPASIAVAAETAEEKIDLTNAKIYSYTSNSTDKVYKYAGEVTEDASYKVFTDGDYTTDGTGVAVQKFVMIDLGQQYPISTIKAYQSTANTSTTKTGNFVSVFDGAEAAENIENFTFVRTDETNLLRTNITVTEENGANCFTVTAQDTAKHDYGMYRYIFLYSWGGMLDISEVEIFRDTTEKTPFLSVRNYYGSNMVLQRNKPHVIKGYSETGTSVSVTMTEDGNTSNTQTKTATPDSDGNWTVSLDAMTAGISPYTITVSDGTTAPNVVLTNVLVGDVFLASGQSNMAYDAPKSATQNTTAQSNTGGPNGSVYYKKGMYELQNTLANENIRMFKMRDDTEAESGIVTEDVPVWIDWCASNGEMTETSSAGVTTSIQHTNILALSSLAAFFADSLIKADNTIPVGIIQASRGGSAINIWSECGRLYNNHIAPLEGLNIAGILWYQGCANSNETGFKTYSSDFKKLIQQYRSVFHDNELPFLYVQLAPNPSPVTVTAHATYTAQFKRTPIIYSVEFIESAGDNSVSLLVPKESNCVLIFAAYDTNGSLLSVELKPLSFDTAKEDTVEPETLKTDGAASIKVMLWDGIDTMKPLCTADKKSL